jgi:hypothetical protein
VPHPSSSVPGPSALVRTLSQKLVRTSPVTTSPHPISTLPNHSSALSPPVPSPSSSIWSMNPSRTVPQSLPLHCSPPHSSILSSNSTLSLTALCSTAPSSAPHSTSSVVRSEASSTITSRSIAPQSAASSAPQSSSTDNNAPLSSPHTLNASRSAVSQSSSTNSSIPTCSCQGMASRSTAPHPFTQSSGHSKRSTF